MRLGHRLRPRPDRIEVHVAPVVLRLVLGPDRLHRLPPARASARSGCRDQFRGSRISSRFQPAPTPNSTRPFEIVSSVATSLAMTIGSRWITSTTPKPSFRPLGHRRDGGQAHERIERVAVLGRKLAAGRVGRLPAHRDVGVLGEEERLESALLGEAAPVAPAGSTSPWRRCTAPPPSGTVPAHREAVQPVDPGDGVELGLAAQGQAGHAGGKESESLLKLGAGDVRAQAVVHSRRQR